MLVLREATVTIRMSQDEAGPRRVTVEGPRVVGNNGRSKREFKCCHKCSKVSVFEASKKGLAKTRCDDMLSVDLNALEIGAVLLLERNHEIQIGIDSCAAVTVFAHFYWFVTKKLQVLCGSECSKGERQAPRCVSLVCESENGRDVRCLGGNESRKRVRTTRDVERNWSWSQTESSSRDCSGQCSDDTFELIAFGAGTDREHDDHDCKFKAPATPEACKTVSVSLAGRVQVFVSRRWW